MQYRSIFKLMTTTFPNGVYFLRLFPVNNGNNNKYPEGNSQTVFMSVPTYRLVQQVRNKKDLQRSFFPLMYIKLLTVLAFRRFRRVRRANKMICPREISCKQRGKRNQLILK